MADSTLDEIIKQKRIKKFNTGKPQVQRKQQPNRNAPKRLQGFQGKRQAMVNKKGRLFKEVQEDLGIVKQKKPVSINTDARNKIIQKQRFKFADARERLAQIAKQGDARDKLNKLRKNNPGEKVVPQQKKPLMKKKIVNVPRQTLNAGQTRMKGAAVIRTVAGADPQRRRNLVSKGRGGTVRRAGGVRGNMQPGRSYPIANNPSIVTVKNNNARSYNGSYGNFRQEYQVSPRAHTFTGGMGVPTPMDHMLSMRPEPLIRTRPAETIVYAREYEPEVRPSRLRITAANTNYRVNEQQYVDPWQTTQAWEPQRMQQQPSKRDYYDDQVEYQVYPKKIQTVAAPQVQPDNGTKVVVSNLHPCVSVEDMEELFGTVGSVVSVRMVRQGVAEAIFINHNDAYRSVDLFNNRQLDGQPMKVMLVRKKGPLMPTPTVQSRSVLKNARGRSGYYM